MASKPTQEQLKARAKADFDREVERAKQTYESRIEAIPWILGAIEDEEDASHSDADSVSELKPKPPEKHGQLYRGSPPRGGISSAVREFAIAAKDDFTVSDITLHLRGRGLYYPDAELAVVAALKRLEAQEEIKKIRRGTNSMPALYRRPVNQGAN